MMMTERAHLQAEIELVLDAGLMSKEDLLDALLASMETPEIRENWEFIKKCNELDDAVYGNPYDEGKYDKECFV
jgi:hypothetical protein